MTSSHSSGSSPEAMRNALLDYVPPQPTVSGRICVAAAMRAQLRQGDSTPEPQFCYYAASLLSENCLTDVEVVDGKPSAGGSGCIREEEVDLQLKQLDELAAPDPPPRSEP